MTVTGEMVQDKRGERWREAQTREWPGLHDMHNKNQGWGVERRKEEWKGRQKEEDPWGQLFESLLVQGCSANGTGRA